MRIVFLGAGAFGVPTLERLCATHDVAMVVTQPDRRAGRGGKLAPTPVGAWVSDHRPEIETIKPERINQDEPLEHVRAVEADAWVVIAYGQKLSQRLLDGVFAINLHASVLPRWRGAAPINAAVLAGDQATGNSVITLADRMDAGLVLGQSHRPIEPHQTAGELHDLLALDGPDLVGEVLAAHAAGTLVGEAQDESLVTTAGKLSRADAWVDFSQPADVCRQRVHGLTPWPGVSVEVGAERLKLHRVEATAGSGTPGTLIDPVGGQVACANGTALSLLEVQPPGKRAMPWDAYRRGRSLEAGLPVRGGPPSEPSA